MKIARTRTVIAVRVAQVARVAAPVRLRTVIGVLPIVIPAPLRIATPAPLRVATPAPLRTAVAVARTIIAVPRATTAVARRTATTKMTPDTQEGRTAIVVVLDETVIRVFVGQCAE